MIYISITFGFMIGAMIGLIVVLFLFKKRKPECEHNWSKWYDWAITWEKRKCLKCGKSQTREF